MKIDEIFVNEQLDEGLGKALGAGILGTALGIGAATMPPIDQHSPATDRQPSKVMTGQVKREHTPEELTQIILDKYRVDPKLAKQVVALAKKYEYDTFPKATDILSIVGIESSFRPHVKSNLKTDPAVGLMQVRPGVWGLDPVQLSSNIEAQVKAGSKILHKYYKRFGNVSDAVHVYNIGPGNFKRGNHNLSYVQKFQNERERFSL